MKLGLHCMDCVEGMARMNDEVVDLVVTSPPYDELRDYHSPGAWTMEKFKAVAKNISRVIKRGGVVVWITNDAVVDGGYTLNSFKQAVYFKEECGLRMHQPLIWNKTNMRFPSPNRYHPSHEWMWVLSKGAPKTFNPIEDRENKTRGARITTERADDGSIKQLHSSNPLKKFSRRMSIWDCNPGAHSQRNKGAREHPAVFPEPLAADHIKSWSNEGDLVMDPFAGSGTTGRMAEKYKREFIGFEISAKYYDLASGLQKGTLI